MPYADRDAEVKLANEMTALRQRLETLLSVVGEEGDFHATILAEFWLIMETVSRYIRTFSKETALKGSSDKEDDFFSEMRAEISHLEANLAQVKVTIRILERQSLG